MPSSTQKPQAPGPKNAIPPSSSSLHFTAATVPPREHLARAQQLLQSGDRVGARYVYSLALADSAPLFVRRADTTAAAQTQRVDHGVYFNPADDSSSSSSSGYDVGACFVARVRLAQLSFRAEDLGAEARDHMVSAWELREHPSLRDLVLAPGGDHALVGRYFRAIGLALRRLYAEAGLAQEEERVMHGLVKLGLADRANKGSAKRREGVGAYCAADQPSPPTAAGSSTTGASTSINNCGDGEGCMILLCEDCGIGEPVEEEDRTGGAFYCEDCAKQFEAAVAEGPRADGTPCAGCTDKTQPVTIDADGQWYCEACVEEFYEELEQEKEQKLPVDQQKTRRETTTAPFSAAVFEQ